jgi:parallel beta-helix repeat protein
MEKRSITVGQTAGELIGRSQVPIQAAIDYLSNMGGGTVHVGEGVYDIETSIHLRSGIRLEGVPGKTIFRKCAAVTSPLAADGDIHQRQITVAHPELFKPGQNVTIRSDDNMKGFNVTVAIITGISGNICYLDRQILQTALVSRNGHVSTNIPVISGYGCEDATVRHITVDGNKEQNDYVEGCRNAGIYLFEAKRVTIEDCTVHDYNGDGISYQCCEDIIVRNCTVLNNNGQGIHPGSGTQRTLIEGCRVSGSGIDGIFVCWRVTDSIVQNCDSSGNAWSGLSIGHKDTHNVIRSNRFVGNGHYGVFFRNEPDPMGANYNRVENNYIQDNGSERMGYVGIRLRGGTREVDIVGNRIVFEKSPLDRTIGVCMEEFTRDIRLDGNEFVGCAKITHHSWLIED